MKMRQQKIDLLIFLLPLLFSACSNASLSPTDSPTTGKINISVDESFFPVVDSEINTFHALYQYADVKANAVPEQLAFTDLMNDSARLIIATRELNKDEKAFFDNQKLFPRVTKIAIDAIAIIINKENKDSVFSLEKLKGIFSGKTPNWKSVDPKSPLGEIQVVFDNSNSGNVRMIKEKFNNNQSLPKNCFAVKTNPEVINYVSQNKNAIGVIGVNWISDNDDTATKGFLNKITVAAISKEEGSESFKPYQAYIAKRDYPLCREVYIISREARYGLGTGFAAFVAGDKGQRIILKSGLVPATMPVRIVNLK